MIFICVGSREYQFNRLLKKIDELIEKGAISDKVFAQIGESSYLPKYYEYARFLSTQDFIKKQKKSTLVISHGGTGSLIGALKFGKKVIAVPRLAKYNEHIDDHQTQVSKLLFRKGFLVGCVKDIDELEMYIKSEVKVKKFELPSKIITIINDFIFPKTNST